jgi:hypothetical protein
VHIDCDLYAPIYSALEYFYPRVVPGGYIVVHDYGSLCWDGAEKAVDVFFAAKPEGVVPMPDSAGSIVVRKLRRGDGEPTWLQRQQLLAREVWHSAANGALSHILDHGWSAAEGWGIWGVGPRHSLNVGPTDPGDFELSLDVHVIVVPNRPTTQVEVRVDGRAVAEWQFDLRQNRAIRSLRVQRPAGQPSGSPVNIELRPSAVLGPGDLGPEQTESRPLGVALHALRLGS